MIVYSYLRLKRYCEYFFNDVLRRASYKCGKGAHGIAGGGDKVRDAYNNSQLLLNAWKFYWKFKRRAG